MFWLTVKLSLMNNWIWIGGVDEMLKIKWYGVYIQKNVDIRGRFLVCSWPNWPKSLLPLLYTFPSTKNNVWTGPQETCSTSGANDQSSCRGVKTYRIEKQIQNSLNESKKCNWIFFLFTCSSSMPPRPSSPFAVLPQQYNFIISIYFFWREIFKERSRFCDSISNEHTS